jgi:hypothetical protein
MADTESPQQAPSARFGARFSPQVLVFVFTLAVASRPLKGAIITGVHWWWGPTYQQVELVMDEAQPNEGYPYIDGHLDGSTEVIRIVGVMQGQVIAPRAAPAELFAPGKRITIWRSAEAPNFTVEGEEVNNYPVANRPVLPGLWSFLNYVAMALLTLLVGFAAMVWVGNRWARRYGTLPISRETMRR